MPVKIQTHAVLPQGKIKKMKQILTIAGSDSGGGAGIQADIKAISANGGFAMSAITSVTAQNTVAVTDAFDLPIPLIEAQLDAVFTDFEVASVKTGMLSSPAIVEAVAEKLRSHTPPSVVVDPVMISKSKFPLLKEEAIDSLKTALIPLATVITPNVYEAELSRNRISETQMMRKVPQKRSRNSVVTPSLSKADILLETRQPMCFTVRVNGLFLRRNGLRQKTRTVQAVPTRRQSRHNSHTGKI